MHHPFIMIEVKLNIPEGVNLLTFEQNVLLWAKNGNVVDYAGLKTAFQNVRIQLEHDNEFVSIFTADCIDYIIVSLFNKDDALKLKLSWG